MLKTVSDYTSFMRKGQFILLSEDGSPDVHFINVDQIARVSITESGFRIFLATGAEFTITGAALRQAMAYLLSNATDIAGNSVEAAASKLLQLAETGKV